MEIETAKFRRIFHRRTDNLDGSVRVNLSNVARSEPLPTVLLEEVFLRFVRKFVVTGRHDVTADQDLTPWTRMIGNSVASFLPILQSDVANRGRCTDSSSSSVVYWGRGGARKEKHEIL